jgi:Mg-chelatase subunit ChlD
MGKNMYKKTLLLLIILPALLFAQLKTRYDILPKAPANDLNSNITDGSDNNFLQNDKYQITLISGGYFTLGTNSGASASTLDDNCQLTFGHPYAKTSFPLFSIDGIWYKPDDFFNASSEIVLTKTSDTLKMTAVKPGIAELNIRLYFASEDHTVRLKSNITNLDSKPHNFGLGLFMDPALGLYGDGALEYKGGYLTESKILRSPDIPADFTIWEKSSGGKGLGLGLMFNNAPSSVTAGNWDELYANNAPETIIIANTIYDLFLKFFWPGSNLQPNTGKEITAVFSLKTPDFPNNIILRWDLPQSIALDNNLLFPLNINSYIQIGKSGIPAFSSLLLKAETESEIELNTTQFQYNSSIPDFQNISVLPQIVYEPATPKINIKLLNGSSVVDEMTRLIHIPATPVSDTGLVIKIDTLATDKLPTVSMVFEAENKNTGNKIVSLTKNNVYLFEDLTRITNFNFTKDTAGGVRAADIVFVLDVTGSMSGQIDAVKRNIIEFADSLSKNGIDYRLGMVTFLDVVENIYPFTSNVQTFKDYVSLQYAHGGGDTPENSLQALLEASRFNFRNNSKRIVIWITDADYHEKDSYTNLVKSQVIDSLLLQGVIVNAIGPTGYKSACYDPFVLATGGSYFDITGNFRDILLSISRINSSYKYLLSYVSPSTGGNKRAITLKVRFAGMGGVAFAEYGGPSVIKAAEKRFMFYPNPFNPEINFKVNKGNYSSARLKIYNVLGQCVKEVNLDENNTQRYTWNAKNENGGLLSSGIYFVTLTMTGNDKAAYSETAKILYLK